MYGAKTRQETTCMQLKHTCQYIPPENGSKLHPSSLYRAEINASRFATHWRIIVDKVQVSQIFIKMTSRPCVHEVAETTH